MTAYKTFNSTAAMGPMAKRRTVLSAIAFALFMTCLFAGYAQATGMIPC